MGQALQKQVSATQIYELIYIEDQGGAENGPDLHIEVLEYSGDRQWLIEKAIVYAKSWAFEDTGNTQDIELCEDGLPFGFELIKEGSIS